MDSNWSFLLDSEWLISPGSNTAYDLRHNYAIENINKYHRFLCNKIQKFEGKKEENAALLEPA